MFVQYPNGQKRVEVKATGEHGFEALSKKDVSADYIMWVLPNVRTHESSPTNREH